MTEKYLRVIKLPGFKESKADIEKYLGKEEGLQEEPIQVRGS